ncbi:MAG: RecX family transcriptional regulator, partial [Pseudomonadota bacterium]
AHLKSKKLSSEEIAEALTALDEQTHENSTEAEYNAALTFARKKRIGPFKRDQEFDPQKELGRLARAGFSYDTARRVLDINSDDFEDFQS